MLPYPVYFHSATVTPSGCMYVFGGVKTLNSTEDVRSNDIFRMWLTQPSLAELCWEVVTACLQCNKALLSEARKLGIPHHFLKRVMWKPLFRDATVNLLGWTLSVIRLVALKIFTDIKLLRFSFITYATFKAIFRVKSLDSEDGFRSGCQNVSHQQHAFSRPQSSRRSFSIKICYSWVQTISLASKFFRDSCSLWNRLSFCFCFFFFKKSRWNQL